MTAIAHEELPDTPTGVLEALREDQHATGQLEVHPRLKTHGGWTYRRLGPTTFEWTSPHGHRHIVRHTH
jgi:hypothetical protein